MSTSRVPRESRDRAGHRRKLAILKRVALGAAVVMFGGGWALAGHHSFGVTSHAATGVTTTTVSSTAVPGLGSADAQGFFAFQSAAVREGSRPAAQTAPSTPRYYMRSSVS